MEHPPEKISTEQLEALIGAAKQVGMQPLNSQAFKQEVEDVLKDLQQMQRKMSSYIASGVLPQRWEYFLKAKRQLRMADRLLRKSIST